MNDFSLYESIFTPWALDVDPRQRSAFGHEPLQLGHTLHHHPLFSRAALAEMIENYPADKYTLVHMGAQGSPKKEWTEGKIGGLSGERVIQAIEAGRLWINLLHINEIDDRYQKLLDGIYEEIADQFLHHPPTFKRICGVLISSPGAQVYYHCDATGQNLWQIAGSKRVWLYRPEQPFLSETALEETTLWHNETSIFYEPWFDTHPTTRIFDLTPGTMLHWPLNAPHRIENGPELSISLTTEFYTTAIRRHVIGVSANGLLRQFGLKPKRTPSGPAFYAKAALFGLAKKSGLIDRKRGKQRPIRFLLMHDGLRGLS